MSPSVYFLYAISLICIVLGFIALLKQKKYINIHTKEITSEVDLPLIGKVKTAYPALIFLFLGVFLAVFVFNKSYTTSKKYNDWTIQGRLQVLDTSKKIGNFSYGELKLIPKAVDATVYPNGVFKITMKLEDGHEFEDEVENITYTNQNFSTYIMPSVEKKKKEKNDSTSILDIYTKTTRLYKPVTLTSF